MIAFTQLKNVAGFESAVDIIRSSEAAIRDAANEWAPLVIAGLYAGDNVAHINAFCNAFTGVRKTRVTNVVKGLLPYKYDNDTQTFVSKDKNAAVVKRKVAKFEAFLAMEQQNQVTFWELVEEVKKGDKKPVDFSKKLTADTLGALEQGLTMDAILSIVQAAAAAAHAAELLKAAAEPKAA